MQSTDVGEVKKPEAEPEGKALDLLRDGVLRRERYETIGSLKYDTINAIVAAVVDKAKRSIPTDGRADEAVQKDRERIERAGESWRSMLVKRVASREKEAANLSRDDLQEENFKERVDALQETQDSYRLDRGPMADETEEERLEAVRQLIDAHQKLEEEAMRLISRYNYIKESAINYSGDMDRGGRCFNGAFRDLQALHADLSKVGNGPAALLNWHILELHGSVGVSTEERGRISVRDNIKAELKKDLIFWHEVCNLHEIISKEYREILKSVSYNLESVISEKYRHTVRGVKTNLKEIGVGEDIVERVIMDKEGALQAIAAKVSESYSKMSDRDRKRLLAIAARTRRAIEADFVDPSYHDDMNDEQKMSTRRYNECLLKVEANMREMGVEEDIINCVKMDKNGALQAIDAKVSEISQAKMSDQKREKLRNMAKKAKSIIEADFIDPDHPYSIYKRQDSMLEELRYAYHNVIVKIDRKANEVKNLTEDKAKKTFVERIKLRSLECEADLFQHITQRHEAKRFARAGGDLKNKYINGIWLRFFNSDIWRYNPTWQEDNLQYRDIDSSGFTGCCGPACLTRILSLYRPEITSSREELQEKFAEIHAHPHGESRKDVGWSEVEIADYLNAELEAGRLIIPMQKGKGVRFEVSDNFSYAKLKDTLMNVKDGEEHYIPIIIGVCDSPEKIADPDAHVIVIHKQGDLHDEQGNHHPDFDVYDPYYVIKPASKYALGHILELSHLQGKYEGSKVVHDPGHMGLNRAVVPVVYDLPESEKPTGAQGSWASFLRIYSQYTGRSTAPKGDK